jgi:hypothetical protein
VAYSSLPPREVNARSLFSPTEEEGCIHLVEAVSNRFKGNAIPRSIAFIRSFTIIPSIHKELGKLF